MTIGPYRSEDVASLMRSLGNQMATARAIVHHLTHDIPIGKLEEMSPDIIPHVALFMIQDTLIGSLATSMDNDRNNDPSEEE